MLPHVETPELLLEMEAAKIVMRWRGCVDRPIVTVFNHGGTECAITLRPVGIPMIRSELTECESDILDVLREAAPVKLTRGQIIVALERGNKVHGESTVGIALASLRDRNLIASPGQGKRDGYTLVEGTRPT